MSVMKVHLQPLGKKRRVQNSGNRTSVVDWSLELSLLKIILLREQHKPRLPSHSSKSNKRLPIYCQDSCLKEQINITFKS